MTSLTSNAPIMRRTLSTLAVFGMFAIGISYGRAEPQPESSSAQAALDESKELNQLAVNLYREGKYREAIGPAERALALREKALGPTHADVATSLNNLGSL